MEQKGRAMRVVVIAAMVAATLAGASPGGLVPAAAAPVPAATNMALLGFSDLGGGGLNGEVTVLRNTAVVAAGIKGDGIPNQSFYGSAAYKCPAVSVKLVDIADPTKPTVVGTIPVDEGVTALDVDAIAVATPTFTGDLLGVALSVCNAAGNNLDRGVAYYDITNPVRPQFLGRYFADFDLVPPTAPACGAPSGSVRCAQSENAVSLVQRADGRVLSMSTQPFASGSNYPSGDLRIVDVTDPRNPTQVGSWPNGGDVPPSGSASDRRGFSKNGCRPIETGQEATPTAGGNQALFAFQDHGMFTLDISDPTNPRQIGQAGIYDRTDRNVDGTASFVASTEVGGLNLALLSDEDWTAPSTRVRIDAPSSVAGSKFACEAMFSLFDEDDQAQVYRKPGAQISGEMVYVGRGCPAAGTITAPDPYLANPAGKIAVIDQAKDVVTQPNIPATGCGSDVKVRRAQDAGATAVIVRRQGAIPEALSETGVSAGLTIPMVQIDQTDGDALRVALCPAIDGAGSCTGGERTTGAIVDSPGEWGGLNIIDNTNPAAPRRFPTYRPPTAGVFPPPDLGVYSVRMAVASGNRAFVASNSDGLRVLDLSNPFAPAEVASYVPADRADPTGQIPAKAYVVGVAVAGANVVISDINSGLYVLGLTGRGYRSVAADGGVFAFGGAEFLGGVGATRLNSPVVGSVSTPSGRGYWLVASDGGVFAFGDARFFGSSGALKLNKPIVAMAGTPSGQGYWLVASDGGVFAFGDARFLGSTGAVVLNKPIVGAAATPSGRGYWLTASDGGVFAFGDARFLGSTGALSLNKPIVGAAATPSGQGYWLVASDGGVFGFGDARFLGSTGALKLNKPISGLAPTPGGRGYWLVASDGGVFAFGDARFLGSTGALRLNSPVVAISAVP